MIEDLLYICPLCLQPDAIRSDKTTVCTSCGVRLQRQGRDIVIDGVARPSHEWYAKICDLPIPRPPAVEIENNLQFKSGMAVLSQARFAFHWKPNDFQYAHLELPQRIDRGQLFVTDEELLFRAERRDHIFPLQEITCVTTDSKHFIFRIKYQFFYQIDFENESPLKFENWTRRILADFWRSHGDREIIEYQPQIRFRDQQQRNGRVSLRLSSAGIMRDRFLDRVVYSFLHMLFAFVLGPVIGTRVIGREKMPKNGPCIVVLNHEGYWDAYFAQVLLPRRIAFFAKNSEFKNSLFRFVLRIFRAIPVKRYQTDASCVRNALAWLCRDQAVGIFVEGERSWDGLFLPLKRGAIRLLIAAGMPIVPVRITGSFEMLPRWGRRIERPRVRLVIGDPINLENNEWSIDSVGEKIRTALALLGDTRR